MLVLILKPGDRKEWRDICKSSELFIFSVGVPNFYAIYNDKSVVHQQGDQCFLHAVGKLVMVRKIKVIYKETPL